MVYPLLLRRLVSDVWSDVKELKMNLQFGVCPQCKQDIDEARLRESIVICQHCGFSDQKSNQRLDKQVYKTFLKTSLVITVLLVGGFIQSVSWDKYAVTIIPLKLKQTLGMASLQDMTEISKICQERLKWDCYGQALAQRYQMSPNTEVETLAELGNLQFKLGQYAQAEKTLSTYFQQGGLNMDASYDYARSLSLQGQVDQASQVYQQILQAKPETLQITVAQNYIKLLMTNNRHVEAKSVLDGIRASGSNANMFMDKEYKEIETYVK